MYQANKGEKAYIEGVENSGTQSHQKPHHLRGGPIVMRELKTQSSP